MASCLTEQTALSELPLFCAMFVFVMEKRLLIEIENSNDGAGWRKTFDDIFSRFGKTAWSVMDKRTDRQTLSVKRYAIAVRCGIP